jgi:hypothetical protein
MGFDIFQLFMINHKGSLVPYRLQVILAVIVGIGVTVLVIGMFGFAIYEMLGLNLIYQQTFTNSAHVIIPDDAYFRANSSTLELRIQSNNLGTYTTEVVANGQKYSQTRTVKYKGSAKNRSLDDTVLILDINKTKEFDISISPLSTQIFKLYVYEKKW